MNGFLSIFVCVLWGSLDASVLSSSDTVKADSTLELVHLVFRHGDRNPDSASLYASSPYYDESYYPEGYGQLTNAGKRTENRLGKLLRARYDDFLGPKWNINMLDVRTTDYNRTKMSAQLMLAGLFPPRGNQIWSEDLDWQPIPYNYFPTTEDKETYPFGCSRFSTLLSEVIASPEINEYIQGRYNETMEIMAANTGETISFITAFSYYFGLLVQDQLGFELPKWTEAVYPEPLHSLAVDYYYLATNNTAIRRVMSGYFLRKVLSDTQAKINGTLSPSERKMFIYSAHESNVGPLVLSLDAYKLDDVPSYGSHVLIEVHKINGVYGLKLFYQAYKTADPIPVKIPGCDYFCPYDQFYSLVEELLPETDEECYGS